MTVFDLVALVIIAAGIFAGWRAGLIKSTVSLVSLAVSLAAAFVLAKPVATFLYEHFWPDAVLLEETVEEPSAVEIDQERAGGLISALTDEKNSEKTVSEIITAYNNENGTDYDPSGFLSVLGISPDKPVPAVIYQISDNLDMLLRGADNWISQTANSGKSYTEAFTRSVNRYLTVTLLSFVVFVAVLILVRLLMRSVAALLTGVINRIPVLGGVNHLLGGAVGAVIGMGGAFLFFVVLRYIALLSTDADFLQLVASSAGYGLADRISALFLTARAG